MFQHILAGSPTYASQKKYKQSKNKTQKNTNTNCHHFQLLTDVISQHQQRHHGIASRRRYPRTPVINIGKCFTEGVVDPYRQRSKKESNVFTNINLRGAGRPLEDFSHEERTFRVDGAGLMFCGCCEITSVNSRRFCGFSSCTNARNSPTMLITNASPKLPRTAFF